MRCLIKRKISLNFSTFSKIISILKMKKIILKLFLVFIIVVGCNSENTVIEEVIQPPKLLNVSSPEAQGMDAQMLDVAFNEAKLKGFVDALLVFKNGYIVGEKYFNGYTQFAPHNVKSVSKSFLSVIAGTAINEGYMTLDDKMLDYFPEYVTPFLDVRKQDITVRHLLSMRMGTKADADDNYTVYTNLYNSNNWVKSIIEAPLMYNPGDVMSYNTFQTHLLSVIVSRATQKSTLAYATESLFTPMQIDVDFWEQDPQGNYFGGNSMYFTPREMLVLGMMYLNDGKLLGEQIIPKSWVDFSLTPTTNYNPPAEFGAFKNYNYAYLWWLGQINGNNMYMAYGYGGQFVAVFPGLDLIVVSTTNVDVTPSNSSLQELAVFDIISNYILPAVR